MPGTARLEDIQDYAAPGRASLSDIDETSPEVKKAIADVPKPSLSTMRTSFSPTGGTLGDIIPRDEPVSPEAQEAEKSVGRRWGQRLSDQGTAILKEASEHPAELAGNVVLPGVGTAGRGAKEVVTGPKRLQGAARFASGAGEALSTLVGPAALENPVPVATGLGIGMGSSEAGGRIAKASGATLETEQAVRDLAFWAPNIVGMGLGIKGAGIDTPEAKGAGISALGDRVRAGVAVTPEQVAVSGKVGPFEGRVNIPRKGAAPAQPALEPQTIEGQQSSRPTDPDIQLAVAAEREHAQAVRMASGLPPVEPAPPAPVPAPPPPIGLDQVAAVGEKLAKLPPDQRAQAMIQAHGELSQILLQQGKVVNPHDGKITIVTKPEQADKLASDIINSEVERRDKLAEEAEKKPSAQPKSEVVSAHEPRKRARVTNEQSDLQLQSSERGRVEEPQPRGATGSGESVAASVQNNGTGAIAHVSDIDESNFSNDAERPAETRPQANEPGREGSASEETGEARPQAVIEGRGANPEQPAPGRSESQPVAKPVGQDQLVARFSKGDKVTLADGSQATISYSAPHMRLVRATTEDGKKLTLSGKDVANLKTVAPEPVLSESNKESSLVPVKANTLKDVAKHGPTPRGGYEYKGGQFYKNGKVLDKSDDIADAIAELEPKNYYGGETIEGQIIGERTAKPRTPGEELQHGFNPQPAEDLGNKARESTERRMGGALPRGTAERRGSEVSVKETKEVAPGEVGKMKVSDLKLAPAKFQYKLGTDSEGVGTLLKETKTFNPNLANTISVWKDPADNKFYVVNGHHRYELAKRTGQKEIDVRHIKAENQIRARAIGAMQNIAEGRGTPIDAAKFFRDSNVTPEELDKEGISMGEATARNGFSLSKLDTPIFNKVVAGDLRVGRGVAIGEASSDPAEQKAILNLVDRKEARGQKISDGTLSELIRFVKESGKEQETTSDLFGSQQITKSLALEKAEISDYIKQQLAKDRKLFGFVAKEGRAEDLARAGNKIEVEKSKEISTGAAQAEEVYNRLSARGGEIATILDEAARELSDGKAAGSVKSAAYTRVRDAVRATLGGGQEGSVRGSEGTPESGKPAKDASDQAVSLFSRQTSESTKKEIARLYRDGDSYRDIRAKLAVASDTIRQVLSDSGIPSRGSHPPPFERSIRDEAIRLYANEDMSATEVGEHLGVSQSVVSRWAKDAGVTRVASDRMALRNQSTTYRHNRGLWAKYISTKTGQSEMASSSYELVRMTQLDADPNVAHWTKKTPRIPWGNGRTYVPDFLVEYKDGTREVEEVKPTWQIDNSDVKAKADAARNYLNERGIGYQIITEKQIGPHALAEFDYHAVPGLDKRRADRMRDQAKLLVRNSDNAKQSEVDAANAADNIGGESKALFAHELIGDRSPEAWATVASRATAKPVQQEGLRPYVEMNSEGLQLVSRALRHNILGASIPPKNLKEIYAGFDEIAEKVKRSSPEAAANLEQLKQALKSSAHPESGVTIVPKRDLFHTQNDLRTLHEELFHAEVQHAPGKGILAKGVPPEMINDPGIKQMRPRIEMETKAQYIPEVIIAEGMVDLVNGTPHGVEPEQAEKTATAYYEALADMHGVEPLEKAQAIQDLIDEKAVQERIIRPGEKFLEQYNRPARTALRNVLERRRSQITGSGQKAERSEVSGREKAAPSGSAQAGVTHADLQSGEGSAGGESGKGSALASTRDVGLTDEELQEWAKSKGFRAEPAGEQLGMFGGNEPVHRVFRTSRGKEEKGLVYQSQLDKLNQPKEAPSEPFALTGGDAREDDQPRLFGAGDLGEIIGGKQEKSALPSKDEDTPSLFHGDKGTFEPGKIKSYIDANLRELRGARDLERGIFDLDSRHQARVLRAVKVIEAANKENGGKAALPDYEQIYHHLEDPDVTLTPKQDKILDSTILPIMEHNDELYQELKQDGVPMENYVHRVVKGKGGWFDRVVSGVKGTGKGNLLSKSAPQTKGRTMMALEYVGQGGDQRNLLHRPGARQVVSVKGGQVTAWKNGQPENLGGISSTEEGKVFEDKDGSIWKLTQATTKEIEQHTELEYYHNALASALVSNLQLAKAVDAQRFIESFKSKPEFKEVAFEGQGNPPKGWRVTQLPQFKGYYFEPHYADVLDRYAQRLQTSASALDKVGTFMRVAMLLNPIMHPLNVSASWAVDRGVTGFLPHTYMRAARAGMKAVKAVGTQNEDFLAALDEGAPLQSHREKTAEVTKLFFDQLGEGLKNEEPWALKVAKNLGLAPVKLIQALHNFSSRVAWLSNDILFLQAAYERQAHGMDFREALRETGRTIPEYRLPAHILNSRAASKVMESRWATIFGSYHYGLLKGFGEVGKSALGLNERPVGGEAGRAADVAKGWDRLALIGLVAMAVYPLLDELAKKMTGDEHARAKRFGPFSVIDAWDQVRKGNKSVGEAAQTSVTPAPQTKAIAELVSNRELYSGRQIYNPHDDWKTQGQQLFRYLESQAGQIGQAQRASQSESQWRKFKLGQVGVQFKPTHAEKVAQDIAHSKMGSEAPEPGESEMYGIRHDVLDALRKGDSGPLEKAVEKGQLSPAQAKRLRHRATLTPLQDTVNNFTYAETLRVREAAAKDGNQQEIDDLEKVLHRKRQNMWARHEQVPAE